MEQGPSAITIGGQQIAPGTRGAVRLPVTYDLDGGEVAIWAHVVHGSRPGPRLGLFSLQHGNEWTAVDMLRTFLQQLDPGALARSVLAVPVCNPISLGTLQRNIQPESDGPDFNRIWPGTHTWLAESMAKVIDREVVRSCDALLDYHLGPWGAAFGTVVYGVDYADPELVARCERLGVAFGYDSLGEARVVGAFPGPRSLTGYAGSQLGIPGLAVEVGGAGFSAEEERGWAAANHRGIFNVMRHLGMLEGAPAKPERMLRYERVIRVNPTIGGLLVPEREPDTLLRAVQRGELLGRIISPYSFEELEQLVAPCDGYLMYLARTYPVRPGDWGFGVIDGATARWTNP